MKNLAIALVLTLVLAACSSGTSVSDTPPTISGIYTGEFESSNELDAGTMILNLAEDESGDIQGTIQFQFRETDLTCLRNGTITGSVEGFSVRLEGDQSGGTITFQLTSNQNTLTGTYVTSGAPCSNFSGSGNITLVR